MKVQHLKDYLPILLALACALVVGLLFLTGAADLQTILHLVSGRPVAAALVILTLFVLKGFSGVITYQALVMGVSLLYDLPTALIINSLGTAVCLTISYQIGCRTKTDSLESILAKHPKLQRYFSASQHFGFLSCLSIHMVGISMEVLGVLFGILRVSFPVYLVSSWLAIAPGMVCFTILGDNLNLHSPVFWILLGANLFFIAIGILFTRRQLAVSRVPDKTA